MIRTVFGRSKIKPFISTWDTTKSGVSSSNQIRLPLTGTFSYVVDWGDGNVEVVNSSNLTHTYPTGGVYTIKIFAKISNFVFNNTGDRLKILSIVDWGSFTTLKNGFKGCSNLTLISVIGFPIIGSLLSLFESCSSITTINNLNLWKPVGELSAMFLGCVNFNDGGLSNWNTVSVNRIDEMFNGCVKFNKALNWNTSNISFFTGAFRGASMFNQDITGWIVSQSVKLDNFLDGANSFNQNLGLWTFNKNVSTYRFMIGNTLSTANYDSLLNKFASNVVGTGRTQTYKYLHAGNSKYSVAGQSSRNSLTTDGWFVSDAGLI